MKKLILLFSFLLLVSACVSHLPIKGKYEKIAEESEVDGSFKEVWAAMINIIARTGANIKLIDKSSGLIVAEKTSFMDSSTYEVKVGKPNNPDAYILTSRSTDSNTPVTYRDVTANYNVLIVPITETKSSVIINVHNINVVGGDPFPYYGISLGNFERKLMQTIKDRLQEK